MRNPESNNEIEYTTVSTLSLGDNNVNSNNNFIVYESESVHIPMTLTELSNDEDDSSDEDESSVEEPAEIQASLPELSDDQKNIAHREYLSNDLELRMRCILIEEERANRRENEISEREYNATPMTDYETREEQLSRREYEIARRTSYLNLRENRVSRYEISIYTASG